MCIDKIPEVAMTNFSKPKRYSLSKLRLNQALLKQLIQTCPRISMTWCGKICLTPPKCIRKERRQNYYSRCSIVAAAVAMSWRHCVFRCESERILFGLQKRTQLEISGYVVFTTLFQNISIQILVCAADCNGGLFPEPGSRLPPMLKGCFYKGGNSNFARTVWRF